jgi:hypothetical protein
MVDMLTLIFRLRQLVHARYILKRLAFSAEAVVVSAMTKRCPPGSQLRLPMYCRKREWKGSVQELRLCGARGNADGTHHDLSKRCENRCCSLRKAVHGLVKAE